MQPITAKVCGINNLENLKSLLTLPVDMVGFVFHKASKRNCTLKPQDVVDAFTPQRVTAKKIGVFVDEPIEEVLKQHKAFELDYVQLHGSENVFYCQSLKEHYVKIIKAFSVDDNFCFSNTMAYEFFCAYFLFDTKGLHPGGNGLQFNWDILNKYKGKTPFLLSGGIGPNDTDRIRSIQLEQLASVDVNSVFEIEPGYKNLDVIADFVYKLKRPESFNIKPHPKKVVNGY